MVIEVLLAVLVVALVANLALLAVTVWSRGLSRPGRAAQGWADGGRTRPGAADVRTVRRRALYVAEPAPDAAIPSIPRASQLDVLPPDLAALVTGSAPVVSPPSPDQAAEADPQPPASDESTGDGPPGRRGGGQPLPLELAPYTPLEAADGTSVVPRLSASTWAAHPGLESDPLTGLENLAGWSRVVDIENARLLRYRRSVTVVMAELEGLRRLAERLGDEPLERLLPVVANAFRREARGSDWVARIGEGRFAALLPETDEIQAINYVERVRLTCEPWLSSAAVPMRLAIGWASPPASGDLEYAIARAEERMHGDRRMPAKALPARGPSPRVVALPVNRGAGSGDGAGTPDRQRSSTSPSDASDGHDGTGAGGPFDGGRHSGFEPAAGDGRGSHHASHGRRRAGHEPAAGPLGES